MRSPLTRRCRTCAATAAVLLVTTLGTSAQSAAADREPSSPRVVVTTNVAPQRVAANTFETRVLRLVNKRRAAKDLRRFRGQACLDRYAEDWAQQISTTGLMVHQNMNVVLLGCDLTWAGEALARGTGLTPRKTVRAWMRSSSHRAVIMKRRGNRVGIGVRYDSEDRAVVVLDAGDLN